MVKEAFRWNFSSSLNLFFSEEWSRYIKFKGISRYNISTLIRAPSLTLMTAKYLVCTNFSQQSRNDPLLISRVDFCCVAGLALYFWCDKRENDNL